VSRIDNAVIDADNAPDDELEVVARITKTDGKEAWEVRDVRGNSAGVYFALNVKTKGGMIAPVTVKHSERHDKLICFTCLTNNCSHTRFVAEFMRTHPTESKAS
jgi:hypothetical protein